MYDANRARPNTWLVFTAALLAATLIVAHQTGTLRHQSVTHPHLLRYGNLNGDDLRSWRVVTVFTTVAFTKGLGNVLGVTWKILLFVGVLEALAGTWRALVAFWATNVAGYLGAYLAIAWPLAATGHDWGQRWFHYTDVGASAGCYGAGVVITQLLPSPWRWLTLSSLLVYIASTLHPDQELFIWDVEHMIALGLGFLLGLWWRSHQSRQWTVLAR